MGTNFYRIPTEKEVESRKARLLSSIRKIDLNPGSIERGFRVPQDDTWDHLSPWDHFTKDISIHLGKRSGGWKFCWNFHDNKWYSNKEELLEFIRGGRVVDEYGEEQEVEEFIDMALGWGQPEGFVHDEQYEQEQRKNGGHIWGPKYYDLIIDGLRVSTSTEFS